MYYVFVVFLFDVDVKPDERAAHYMKWSCFETT